MHVLAIAVRGEFDDAVREREERVILPDADVLPGVKPRAALADENVAREHLLAAELLDAQTLRVGIAPVARGARALLGRKELEVEKEHSRHTIAEGRALRQTGDAQSDALEGNVPSAASLGFGSGPCQASAMLLSALLFTLATDTAYAPTQLKPSDVFTQAKSASGKLAAGTYTIVRRRVTHWGTTVWTQIRSGDDSITSVVEGPFTSSYGVFEGQHWRKDENGNVLLESDFRAHLDTPWQHAIDDPDNPRAGVRVLGLTTSDPQRIVLDVHPRGEQDQYRYYDAATHRLTEVVTYTKTGERDDTRYSDYRTAFGETLAYSTHFSDGDPKDEWTETVDSFEETPQAAVPPVPVPHPLYFLDKGSTVSVPVRFTRNSGIIVTASIDGKPVNFVLDSGASALLIDPGVAAGLNGGRSQDAKNGNSVPNRTVFKSVEIGGLKLADVAFDEATFHQNTEGIDISGLLGFDFIAGAVVKIDFKAQQVTLLPRSTFDPAALGVRALQTQLDDGVPRIQASIEGVPGWFLLDTGSFATIVHKDYIDKLASAPMTESENQYFYGLDGANQSELRALSDLVFGGIDFRTVRAWMPDGDRFMPYGYDGLIGRDVLSNYVIYLDYLDDAVYVKPNL